MAWLNADRARAYARLLAGFMALALAYGWVSLALGHHPGAAPPSGQALPGPSDFLSFWTAGRMVLHGHAASAYDLAAMGRAEAAATAMPPGQILAFFYPPVFLLLCVPFAVLPYLAAFAVFVGGQLVLLVALLRRVLPPGWGVLPVLAFPGLLMNAATGQNGFISAICFTAAALCLDRRPLLGGACLGGLVFKPHLALVVPVMLLAARRWQALLACAVTACALMLLSVLVLGLDAWVGFLRQLPAVRAALEQHAEDWGKLQSLFTTARLLGAPLGVAYGLQTLLAFGVFAALGLLAWRRPGGRAEVAVAAAAAMLTTPHLLDYDLAVIGLPLAWLAAEASRTFWHNGEKLAAALAFLWPLVGRLATQSGWLPVAPLILLGLFAVLMRRAWPAGLIQEALP